MKLQEFVKKHKEDIDEFRREFLKEAIKKGNVPTNYTYSIWVDLFYSWADHKRRKRDKEGIKRIKTIVNIEVDKMLENQLCTICNKPFLEQKEKEETVCSGTHPLTYAHGECWGKRE